MDHVHATKRSEMMRSVGQKNTKPEVLLRSALHLRGLRFRLHRKDLKGRPDIVFPKYRTCMFVHGCFWHRHGCSRSTTPKSNSSFWHDKFRANVARDRRAVDELLAAGWRVLTVWECGILGKGRAEEAAAFVREWLKTDKREGEYPFPQASIRSSTM
ncbi:hypothetical protein ASF53_14105 [Methylobacterium sp. Leaf123]|uniref:very short patch repair endonuclease n=1 Tax=Methylobacterium sp. Leaf123 TaxID=1736264 RepID=UPI0006FA1441|nr:very short patch repair endonuclease [Methylobacterium sp. Leaf123]KQQ13299.1 hypothetical protein ASF53_14105 [Methylobacterium sp. Leaf123]